jgi:hypothetical protein
MRRAVSGGGAVIVLSQLAQKQCGYNKGGTGDSQNPDDSLRLNGTLTDTTHATYSTPMGGHRLPPQSIPSARPESKPLSSTKTGSKCIISAKVLFTRIRDSCQKHPGKTPGNNENRKPAASSSTRLDRPNILFSSSGGGCELVRTDASDSRAARIYGTLGMKLIRPEYSG